MTVTFKELGHMGRMGNILFQCSAVIALAKRNNDSYIFPPWPDSKHFNIPQSNFQAVPNFPTYKEPRFAYDKITYSNNINLSGYFQSERYFKDYEHKIRSLLTPKYSKQINDKMCSIHVRRTDYLSFPDHHPVLNMDYYEKAMNLINADKYLVFSDDINWCKKHFIGNNFEFSEGNPAYIDLSLMSKCTNHIIANSSFSWWGAWLNRRADKKVIAPKKWFGSALNMHDTKDLFPEAWTKL